MEYTNVIRRAGDGVLSALRRAETTAVSTLDRVSVYVPDLPFQDRLPSPKPFVKALFRVWKNLVVTQRNYTLGLVDAFNPLADIVATNGRPHRRPARGRTTRRRSQASA